jgi:hypothetical protein
MARQLCDISEGHREKRGVAGIRGGSGNPDPPFRVFQRAKFMVLYCTQPVAVNPRASEPEHKELAWAISSFVGVKGGPSTFDAVACVISFCASDARRNPFATFLFVAAVTTQT